MPYIDHSCASFYMLPGVGSMKRLQLADDRQFCMSLDQYPRIILHNYASVHVHMHAYLYIHARY